MCDYDYLHRRVRKRVYTRAGGVWPANPSDDRRFVYDGWNVLLELGRSPEPKLTHEFC